MVSVFAVHRRPSAGFIGCTDNKGGPVAGGTGVGHYWTDAARRRRRAPPPPPPPPRRQRQGQASGKEWPDENWMAAGVRELKISD